MKWVLDRMEEEDLYLTLAKCAFDQTEVEYPGLIVKDGEVLMDPTKLKAVEQWEPPKLVKAVRSFIVFCNFYLLHSLRNLISSSTHSSVVRGHVELLVTWLFPGTTRSW